MVNRKFEHKGKRTFNRNIVIILFLLISFVTLLFGCKKDETNTEQNIKKVLSKEYSNGALDTYEYNANGKISKISSNGHYVTYVYSGNLITETWFYSGGDTLINEHSLNSEGYISRTIVNHDPNLEILYEYDSEGHCIKQTIKNPYNSGVVTYKYLDGNMMSISYNGVIEFTHEYYIEKENRLSNEYYGMIFLGKSDKNLLKKSSTSHSTLTQTYEFDQDNYVSKIFQTRSDGSSYQTIFTYK